jgi:hypothetical protein
VCGDIGWTADGATKSDLSCDNNSELGNSRDLQPFGYYKSDTYDLVGFRLTNVGASENFDFGLT